MGTQIIMGLYRYRRGNINNTPKKTLEEIVKFLEINENTLDLNKIWYLAGDYFSRDYLIDKGLKVTKTFSDAPDIVKKNSAHLMKHFMVLWALSKKEEVLWLDWDVIFLKPLDNDFWGYARINNTPKFIKIPGYWATVNCGAYFVNKHWKNKMLESFKFINQISEPNDELLWAKILPKNIFNLDYYWWNDRIINIYYKRELSLVSKKTYAVHVRDLEWAKIMKTILL